MSTSKRLLRLVDEQRASRVHRPEGDHPLFDAGVAHVRHHAIGQVDQLDAIVGLDRERVAVDHKAARGRHDLLDRGFARGHDRTLAHLVERINETESIEHRCSPKVLGPFRRNGPLGYRAYTPLSHQTPHCNNATIESSTDAYPGRQGSWVQSPHGPATVSGHTPRVRKLPSKGHVTTGARDAWGDDHDCSTPSVHTDVRKPFLSLPLHQLHRSRASRVAGERHSRARSQQARQAVTETVIVSASHVDQPLSRTPDSVTVISGRELERASCSRSARRCARCPASPCSRAAGLARSPRSSPAAASPTSRSC